MYNVCNEQNFDKVYDEKKNPFLYHFFFVQILGAIIMVEPAAEDEVDRLLRSGLDVLPVSYNSPLSSRKMKTRKQGPKSSSPSREEENTRSSFENTEKQ